MVNGKKQIMMVVTLDLLATFDMVDHNILLTILNRQFGISDKVLEWFNSYLQPRFFRVQIGNTTHNPSNYTLVCHRGHVVAKIYLHAIAH